MKKAIMIFCLIFIMLAPMNLVHAQDSYSGIFSIVGDAMMKTKAGEWASVQDLAEQLTAEWKQTAPKSKAATEVDKAMLEMNAAVIKENKEETLAALSDISHALVALEKEQNPVDEAAHREEIKTIFFPMLDNLKASIGEKDALKADAEYKKILSAWSKKEGIIREQSIAHYGKIETQLGLLRIALTQEEKDFGQMQMIAETMSDAFTEFVAGKEVKAANEGHSLQTLINLLEKADQAIDEEKPEQAVASLQDFLTIWPSVEGEVRTRNGGLYTKLESGIPVIAGKLSSSGTDLKEQQKKINAYKMDILQLQEKTSYTIWDAALILLREGLEALLIIAALIAFLRKANARQYQKWIWIGALLGVAMSACAALLINVLFTAASQGANREVIEGITGIIAVIMMIGVGIWLHQKSNIQAWNHFIEKQMGAALSTGSIVSMAFISFLAIFREGAETIIFYMGMAPSIGTGELAAGIGIATAILVVLAFLLIRYSSKIAVGLFFKSATVLIYFLAFKILGVSIHALQLTDHIRATQLHSLPTINLIGFYPSLEVIIPQILLLAVIMIASFIIHKPGKHVQPS
ncbi:transporter [Siminovitchia acidinfaciens]|uniref:Transporter n=1 Tax=Siminovitchia acidinfaciens TaxID=2321395 RepID=A0A429XW51_9BACI|nr:FTR1 family protein [Siminovitchia acidinfaciens]RST72584.1 transporter [Siminovitchia acidinfaciens]